MSEPLRVRVVGGGPGGLFLAALLKRRRPDCDIEVVERNAPDATFGFGVVFSERTLDAFATADPGLPDALAQQGVEWTDIEVRRDGRRLRCGGHGFSAIARKTLLRVLQERAREAGVSLCFEHEASVAEHARADVVVAADGVNSGLRAAGAFGPRVDRGAARFIWFATPQPFDALTFLFEEDEHGQWGVHAYPFENGTSTFIVETDVTTWRRAGLDAVGDLPPGESDLASLAHVERLFAAHLGDHGLLHNSSRWQDFGTLRCDTWRDGRTVLLGDAAHTAHFSVGSGTKMAMEDAVALADALADVGPAGVPRALAAYEAARRPAVERIQTAAAPSIVWWERFRFTREQPLEQMAFHFLTRSPAITRERLRARDRRFVHAIDAWATEALGADPHGGILATPVALGGLELVSRLVVAPPTDGDVRASAMGAARFGAGLVLLDNPHDAETVAALHGETRARAGLRLAEEGGVDVVDDAVAAGYDVLAAPLDAPAARAWPGDRLLLAEVRAPAASEGPAADALLDRVRELAADRLLAVAVAVGDGLAPESQLLLCDRVVQELGLPCLLVDGARDADQAATAVLAGRVALVQGLPSLVSPLWAPSPPRPALRRPSRERTLAPNEERTDAVR